MQQGFNSKILINNNAYSTARWSVDVGVTDIKMANVSGALKLTTKAPELGMAPFTKADSGYMTRRPGIADAEVRISQATFDNTENPFAAPLIMTVGLRGNPYYSLQIFPAGKAGVQWSFPYLMIIALNQVSEADWLSPTTFVGRSHGIFYPPAA